MENHLTKKSPTPNSNKTPNLVSKRSAMLDKIHASLMYMKFSRLCTNLEGGSKNLMKMKKKNRERDRRQNIVPGDNQN